MTEGGQLLIGGLTFVTATPNPVLSGSPLTLTADAVSWASDPLVSVSYYLDVDGGSAGPQRRTTGRGHGRQRRVVGHHLNNRLVRWLQHGLRARNHGQRRVDQLGRHYGHRPPLEPELFNTFSGAGWQTYSSAERL